MNKFNQGSKAHRAHMSRVMKEAWAKRRNRIKSREALANFSAIVSNVAPDREDEKPTRVVTFNYCPNCGEHLARLYS